MPIPSDADLLTMFADGKLASAMARRFDLEEEADLRACEAACARLHNTRAWDLLSLVERGEIQALEGSDFFVAAHVLEQILPALDVDPSRMMAAVEALVAAGGDDMAASQPNAAFREWCARDPTRAWRIIEAARNGDPVAARNLTFPLEALTATDEARRILVSNDNRLKQSAITALGRITDKDPVSRAATVAAFTRAAEDADDVLRASLLRAATFLLSVDGAAVGEAEVDLLRRLTAQPGDHVIHAAAVSLWADKGARSAEAAPMLLHATLGVKASNKGTVHQLDHALRTLLKEGQADLVLEFVGRLFSGSGELELEQLTGFLSTLATGPSDLLARAVVAWLLSGEDRLCEGLSKTLRRERDDAPILDVTDQVRDLSGVEQLFLCRKAITWFFIKPKTAASVLVSVLRVCDDKLAEQVQSHLVQPLLVNYGGLREYLEALDPEDAARVRVAAALAENDAYLAGLRSVPPLRELQPSEAQRRVQHLRMADQSREIAKQARKHSVFLSLVKRSVLLHGRRSLSFITDPDGNQRRFEMDLQPHSVSFELPRMEIVDPVGLDYMLRVYRAERIAR